MHNLFIAVVEFLLHPAIAYLLHFCIFLFAILCSAAVIVGRVLRASFEWSSHLPGHQQPSTEKGHQPFSLTDMFTVRSASMKSRETRWN